ncbi:hypothetical protein U5820_18230 [Enterobacter asburiae]|uniref:Lar family restriction alleviation protein n=1 Tax=Enterobacter asburiae TaxID=61645 RepID=UPI002ADE00E2|nr:hypothetical protein [Enterobacter asburiae]MEA1019607.1 hypothetical protein [Enterobacter asburiae]
MKLLPCPFCGGEPEEDGGMFFEFYGHERQDYSIACKKCRAEVRCDVGEHEWADAPCSCHHDTRQICAEKWNSRAAPPAPASVPDEDLLHMAASAIEDLLSNKDRYCAGVWADIPAKLRRAAMLQGADGNSPVIPDCSCRTCRPVTFSDSRFVVCPECGNKRCPHANDHRNACSGSNEPGQEGSAYPAAPQQEVAQALAKGMERYGDAMQELAKKEVK